MKSKIAAYTLSEMLIVIIVSSIIIGIAFSVLTLIKRHMWSIQENLKVNTELNKLEQSLWVDFNTYHEVSFSNIEDKLLFKSEIDSIVYNFNSDFIIKASDTFHIEIDRKVLFFNGNETAQGEMDAIRLELPKEYGNQHVFVFKRNDALQFMN